MNDELTAAVMPKTKTPNMTEIKFAVPTALLEELLEMADLEGWKPAELHRLLWERGFAVYAEGSNKRYVNKKLRAKYGSATTEEIRELLHSGLNDSKDEDE